MYDPNVLGKKLYFTEFSEQAATLTQSSSNILSREKIPETSAVHNISKEDVKIPSVETDHCLLSSSSDARSTYYAVCIPGPCKFILFIYRSLLSVMINKRF